jgi:hypothetical protein
VTCHWFKRLTLLPIMFILLFLFTLFPPFYIVYQGDIYDRQWGFLFDPPHSSNFYPRSMSVDIQTLSVEYVLIFLVGGTMYFFKKKKGGTEK